MSRPTNVRAQRRLAALGQDEEGKTHPHQEQEIIEPAVAEHHGRIFKTTGDGFLVEFPSPMEAVRCAVSVQDALASRAAREPSRTLQHRIGINLGDLIIEEELRQPRSTEVVNHCLSQIARDPSALK